MAIEPLKPAEARLVRDCYWARTKVEGGRFLPALRWRKAVSRMVERGYLTASDPAHGPGSDWPVVLLTQENWDKLRVEQPQLFAAT